MERTALWLLLLAWMAIGGKPVRLRFLIQDAYLYSLRFR